MSKFTTTVIIGTLGLILYSVLTPDFRTPDVTIAEVQVFGFIKNVLYAFYGMALGDSLNKEK